jgi:hypothetical protein
LFQPGQVVSYLEMCRLEGVTLQRGMNFRIRDGSSIVLMSLRAGAPYADRVEEGGRVLIYEGHDSPRSADLPNPKLVDQPTATIAGSITQNGRFMTAARAYKRGTAAAEVVRVYEKMRQGVWVFNGSFRLVDAWVQESGGRTVCKFRLEVAADVGGVATGVSADLDHVRMIPSAVKLAVWQRDRGRCTLCGSQDNLHFDHILPFSKGGSSLVGENIQLLCARHNLLKHDRIE